jgi:oligosaccharide repeat unit polymerase
MLSLTIFLTLAAALMIFLKWFVRKEIFDPVFFTAAYWVGFIVFSLLISLKMNFVFFWIGVLPLMLLLLAFLTGGFVMKQLMNHFTFDGDDDKKILRSNQLSVPAIRWLVLLFSGFGLMAIYMQLDFLKISIHSVTDLMHAANRISVIRYNGGADMPKSGLVLMAFLYSGGFLGGIYSVVSKGWLNKIIALIPFAVMLVFTLINGVKTGFLFILVIWVSGFAAAYVYEKKGELKKPGKTLLRAMLIILIVLLLIPVTQVLRGGRADSKMKFVNASALSYFCSFNAFTVWYNSYNNDDLAIGKYSLSGVHNYFNGDRQVGLYGDDNTVVGVYDQNTIRTNVYTMTRGLIQDFTLFGAMAVLFLAGIIMQMVYVSARRRNILAMGVLGLFYSVLLWSFTVNILNYNTMILSWIISIGIIFFIRRRAKTIHQTKEV